MTYPRPTRDQTNVQYPYGPAPSRDDLPALRYVILSDTDHQVQHIDESADTIRGYWESPSLNRPELQQVAAVWNIKTLLLYYSARDDHTIEVSWTGDGGRVWTNPVSWTLTASRDGIRSDMKGFNVTGYDLRFRLIFRVSNPISIHGYRPRMIPRGIIIGAGR